MPNAKVRDTCEIGKISSYPKGNPRSTLKMNEAGAPPSGHRDAGRTGTFPDSVFTLTRTRGKKRKQTYFPRKGARNARLSPSAGGLILCHVAARRFLTGEMGGSHLADRLGDIRPRIHPLGMPAATHVLRLADAQDATCVHPEHPDGEPERRVGFDPLEAHHSAGGVMGRDRT